MRSRFGRGRRMDYVYMPVVIVLSAVMVRAGQSPPARGPLPQLIPETTLRVALPADWQIVRGAAGGNHPQLKHVGAPAYEVQVGQSSSKSYGSICIDFIGGMMSIKALHLHRVPRPAYVPDVYVQSIADGGNFQLACIPTGTGAMGVAIILREGIPKPQVLTPLLTLLADAALRQSRIVSAPQRLELPRLGIAIVPTGGGWGHHTRTDATGTHDVVQRAATPGSYEVAISAWRFVLEGRCDSLMRAGTVSKSATRVPERQYGGAAWHADALEQFPAPFKGLQAFVCRNVSDGSMLLARLDYEVSAVRDDDRKVIRAMLDEIGDAYQRRVDSQKPK